MIGFHTRLLPNTPERVCFFCSGERKRTRHLLSVIDEGIYKRGVFKKLGPSKKLKAAVYMAVSYVKARKVTNCLT